MQAGMDTKASSKRRGRRSGSRGKWQKAVKSSSSDSKKTHPEKMSVAAGTGTAPETACLQASNEPEIVPEVEGPPCWEDSLAIEKTSKRKDAKESLLAVKERSKNVEKQCRDIKRVRELLTDDDARHAVCDKEFADRDKDGSGDLDVTEIVPIVFSICECMSLKFPTEGHIAQLVHECDKSGDGRLQLIEFRTAFTTILKSCVAQYEKELAVAAVPGLRVIEEEVRAARTIAEEKADVDVFRAVKGAKAASVAIAEVATEGEASKSEAEAAKIPMTIAAAATEHIDKRATCKAKEKAAPSQTISEEHAKTGVAAAAKADIATTSNVAAQRAKEKEAEAWGGVDEANACQKAGEEQAEVDVAEAAKVAAAAAMEAAAERAKQEEVEASHKATEETADAKEATDNKLASEAAEAAKTVVAAAADPITNRAKNEDCATSCKVAEEEAVAKKAADGTLIVEVVEVAEAAEAVASAATEAVAKRAADEEADALRKAGDGSRATSVLDVADAKEKWTKDAAELAAKKATELIDTLSRCDNSSHEYMSIASEETHRTSRPSPRLDKLFNGEVDFDFDLQENGIRYLAEADMARGPEITPVYTPEVLYDSMAVRQVELQGSLGDGEQLCFVERARDAITYVQTKLSAIVRGSTVAVRVCAVKDQGGVSCVWCKMGEATVIAKIWGDSARGFVVKTLGQASREIGIVLHSVKLKVHYTYNLSAEKLGSALQPCFVRARSGVACIGGKVDKMFVCVKANGDRAREMALAACRGVQASLGGKLSRGKAKLTSTIHAGKTEVLRLSVIFHIKVRDGVLFLRCRIWDTSVLIKTWISPIASRAVETFRLSSGTVEGGCLYAMGIVGGVTLRFKAQIVETGERVTVQAWNMSDRPRSDITLAAGLIHEKAACLFSSARSIAADADVKAVARSAAGGAVILGTTGGAAGLMTGGFVGATIGVVPALFTFGLSIPVGAAIGGGAGLCVGTVAGSSAGLISGGFFGYGARTGALQVAGVVEAAKDYVCETAALPKAYLRSHFDVGNPGGNSNTGSELFPGDIAAGVGGNGSRAANA